MRPGHKALMLIQEKESSPMESPLTESAEQWTESGVFTSADSSGPGLQKSSSKPQHLNIHHDVSFDTEGDLSEMSPMGAEEMAASDQKQLSPIMSQSSDMHEETVVHSLDKETDVQSLVGTADANLSPITFTESKATSPMSIPNEKEVTMVDASSSPLKDDALEAMVKQKYEEQKVEQESTKTDIEKMEIPMRIHDKKETVSEMSPATQIGEEDVKEVAQVDKVSCTTEELTADARKSEMMEETTLEIMPGNLIHVASQENDDTDFITAQNTADKVESYAVERIEVVTNQVPTVTETVLVDNEHTLHGEPIHMIKDEDISEEPAQFPKSTAIVSEKSEHFQELEIQHNYEDYKTISHVLHEESPMINISHKKEDKTSNIIETEQMQSEEKKLAESTSCTEGDVVSTLNEIAPTLIAQVEPSLITVAKDQAATTYEESKVAIDKDIHADQIDGPVEISKAGIEGDNNSPDFMKQSEDDDDSNLVRLGIINVEKKQDKLQKQASEILTRRRVCESFKSAADMDDDDLMKLGIVNIVRRTPAESPPDTLSKPAEEDIKNAEVDISKADTILEKDEDVNIDDSKILALGTEHHIKEDTVKEANKLIPRADADVTDTELESVTTHTGTTEEQVETSNLSEAAKLEMEDKSLKDLGIINMSFKLHEVKQIKQEEENAQEHDAKEELLIKEQLSPFIPKSSDTPELILHTKDEEADEEQESGLELTAVERSMEGKSERDNTDQFLSENTDSLFHSSTLKESFHSDQTLSDHTFEADMASDNETTMEIEADLTEQAIIVLKTESEIIEKPVDQSKSSSQPDELHSVSANKTHLTKFQSSQTPHSDFDTSFKESINEILTWNPSNVPLITSHISPHEDYETNAIKASIPETSSQSSTDHSMSSKCSMMIESQESQEDKSFSKTTDSQTGTDSKLSTESSSKSMTGGESTQGDWVAHTEEFATIQHQSLPGSPSSQRNATDDDVSTFAERKSASLDAIYSKGNENVTPMKCYSSSSYSDEYLTKKQSETFEKKKFTPIGTKAITLPTKIKRIEDVKEAIKCKEDVIKMFEVWVQTPSRQGTRASSAKGKIVF